MPAVSDQEASRFDDCHFRNGKELNNKMALAAKQLADFISWLRKSPIWLDDGILKLYLHCLEKASHNHYDWRGLHLQPGDLPLSEVNTAQALNWSRDKLRKRIRLLEATGFVSLNTTPGVGTVLHIAGWPQNDASDATDCIKTRPVWPDYDASDSTDCIKTRPVWPDYDTSDSADCIKTRPVWPENDTNPQSPICHECQQNHTGSCESGSLIIQEQSSDQTGRTQTCLDDIQYPYNKNNIQYKLNILPGYSTQNEPIGFTDIWFAYPQHRRTHRGEAASLVDKALNEGVTIGSILGALEEDKQSMDWQIDDGQYIPGIVKWLQRESWRSYLPESRLDMEETDEMWVTR